MLIKNSGRTAMLVGVQVCEWSYWESCSCHAKSFSQKQHVYTSSYRKVSFVRHDDLFVTSYTKEWGMLYTRDVADM